MQTALLNSLASWWFKKRLSDLEIFLYNPYDTQKAQMNLLLNRARNTCFGKKYGFGDIKKYSSFIRNIPLHNYESLFPYITRMMKGEKDVLWPGKIKWFAKSSGTTSAKSKFIPVSEEALESTHFQGARDVVAYYLSKYPQSKLLKGKTLKLGGSKRLLKIKDAYVGDLSAIMIDNMPFWTHMVTVPEKKTALLPDWEIKLKKIIDEALKSNLTGLAGVPSWMMMLLKEVLKKTKKKHLLEIWPDIEVFFHGGVSFAPYREEFQKLFPAPGFHYMEIYNASEGFFALQDMKKSEELLLMLDYGIFYEFIPMDEYNGVDSKKIIPLSQVKKGINYAMVISTNSGLWRYIIGDTVKFTSLSPYRIKITGRTKHFINVFGEEVVIENTDKAIEIAAGKTGASIREYTLAPVFMGREKKGAHEWIIEFERPPRDFEKFKIILDKTLQELNSDYQAKRYGDLTLDFPVIHKAKKNLFYTWLKQKDKLGGQNKVPRLSNERDFIEELLALNK